MLTLLLLSGTSGKQVYWMLWRVYGQYPFKGYENQFCDYSERLTVN